MDTSILKSDPYIDAYLAGTMTAEDKQAFEEQLQQDKDLQRRVALHREIITAIRERRMRELTQKFEAQVEQGRGRLVRELTTWTLRILSPVAIAACLFGFIVHLPQVHNIKQINTSSPVYAQAHTEMQEAYTSLKGCEDIAGVILQADELMQAGEYKQADKLLTKELKEMQSATRSDTQAWADKETMLYLQALCALQQKQVYRSRALLTKVVSMDIPADQHGHKEKAQELLNQIKGK